MCGFHSNLSSASPCYYSNAGELCVVCTKYWLTCESVTYKTWLGLSQSISCRIQSTVSALITFRVIPIDPESGSIERAWQELSKTVIKSEIGWCGTRKILYENARRHSVSSFKLASSMYLFFLLLVGPMLRKCSRGCETWVKPRRASDDADTGTHGQNITCYTTGTVTLTIFKSNALYNIKGKHRIQYHSLMTWHFAEGRRVE